MVKNWMLWFFFVFPLYHILFWKAHRIALFKGSFSCWAESCTWNYNKPITLHPLWVWSLWPAKCTKYISRAVQKPAMDISKSQAAKKHIYTSCVAFLIQLPKTRVCYLLTHQIITPPPVTPCAPFSSFCYIFSSSFPVNDLVWILMLSTWNQIEKESHTGI